MSNWLAVIIGAAIGVLLGGTVTSCFALKAIRGAAQKMHGSGGDEHIGVVAGYADG